ncbi:MAG: NAD-dependent succinate-semialdehyde dehydrogenase [Pseudomonadota bacterium]|nr:NAD-dependent succinate-semialdehyde dehydrogenase [Pseudomonadota bacterium]
MALELKDPSLLQTRAFVGGAWTASPQLFAVRNPANGAVVAEVADVGLAGARAAIDAAEAARHAWAARTAKDRGAILKAWAKLMLDNADDLGRILCAEMGKPLAEAKGEIAYGASFIDWFAEEGRRVYGDVIPGHQPDKRILVLKQPIGVAASITPWNFPNAMIARKVAPALAAGCAFVARPSELTPLSALAMAVLAERAGVPKGVFSVVTTAQPAEVGLEFCANPNVKKLSFTGSTRVGALLMKQAADGIKKLSLELGGNAPFIVFDDADLDAAVEGALIAKYRNAGQTCVCANRIYAQAAIHDAFAAKLSAAVSKLKVGDGMGEGVQIGPLISPSALKKVESHVEDALAKGAKLETGGRRHAAGDLFYTPTVLSRARADMKLAHEETFGPLAPIFAFDTVEEVIAAANDTDAGLASYFYARDLSRVWKVAEALEYGMVGVNTGLISTAEAPFGGVKTSGFGREGSKYGIDEYLTIKYVCLSV